MVWAAAKESINMEYIELCGKIEEKIADCREKCQRDREDPFLSHVSNSELETLEALYNRIREEGLSEELPADLKSRLAELEQEKEREDMAPSFSWYGDHYCYLVLKGECDAYQGVIDILEEEKQSREE